MALKTDYKDDQLDLDVNLNRRFRLNAVSGETDVYEFEDVTEYDVEGDRFGANDINSTNEEINNISSNLTQLEANLTSLLNKITFKKLPTVTGTATVNVPLEAEEVLVYVTYNNTSSYQITLTKYELSNTDPNNTYGNGSAVYAEGRWNNTVSIYAFNNTIKLKQWLGNVGSDASVDRTNSCKVTVYWR